MNEYGLQFGKRIHNESKQNWEIIDVEHFRITRPTVFIIGGMGTFSDRQANGYCKLVGSLLGVFSDDVDIVSTKYSSTLRNDEIFDYIIPIVDNLFVPLISENNKRLDIMQACKNMRRLTMFSHCYGAEIVREFENILSDRMYDLGYNSAEQDKILRQAFLVSYASFINNNDLKCKFVDVTSPEDDMLFYNGYWIWNNIINKIDDVDFSAEDLNQMKKIKLGKYDTLEVYPLYKGKERCFIYREDNGLYLATTHLHKTDTFDHSLIEMSRKKDWKPHQNTSKAGDFVSRCLSCALCHSVATSIMNEKSDSLVPLKLSKLKKELESVVSPLNHDQKDYLSTGFEH